jgi:TIR domain
VSGVFVSHASADREFVDRFVDQILRLGCGLPPEMVFYSSSADTGVPSGSDLGSYVRKRLEDVSLVIAIITPTFQTRPYCVAELGAAWGRVGRLFPLLAPGVDRNDLDGVLKGMVIGFAHERAALDELHDAVENATGVRVRAATWGSHKERWMTSVDELASRVAVAKTVSIAEHEALQAQLVDVRTALTQSEDELRKTQNVAQKLAEAKTAEEVREALLPEGEIDRFRAILGEFWDAGRQLGPVVVDAMWYALTRKILSWPPIMEDESWLEATRTAVEDGYLYEDYSGNLSINTDFPAVKRAYDTVKRLDKFLVSAEPGFIEWFFREYDLPPDLSKKKVWSTLSHRPYARSDLGF